MPRFKDRRWTLAAAIAAFVTLGGGAARATVIYASPGATLVNLGTGSAAGMQATPSSPVTVGGETISWSGSNTGIYAGSVAGYASSPYAGGSLQDYLAVEPGGQVTIGFASAQSAFSLLWGTVDSYNSATFSSGVTITGAQIAAAVGSGNQMVTIANLAPFTSVTLTSTSPAFEFDPGTPVPEPGSLALLGAAVLGLGALRLRRRA